MSRRKVRMLPSGCGYQGYEFGAAYPDSTCYGGKLYDDDNCDGEGNLYKPLDEIPCPMCHPKKYVEYRVQLGWTPNAAKALTANIRDNRKNGTEPWKTGTAKGVPAKVPVSETETVVLPTSMDTEGDERNGGAND